MTAPIFVTQPLLPPLEEFLPYLEGIWKNKWLTNSGPYHEKLEKALAEYLGVEYLSLFANGTLALFTALQALRISGEVITTPYSFVATSNALLWNGVKPVFVDTDKDGFNIDPARVEAAINSNTSAILGVHSYGHPCNTEELQRIATEYGLKLIYDAAHSFGVKDALGSILRHGDLSILSFHATKVFNTFEGGAIVSRNLETKKYIDNLKNFGFIDEASVVAPGINGKMNEIQAAFGLLQLNHIDNALRQRQAIDACYRKLLNPVSGIYVPPSPVDVAWNYAYFPILVKEAYPLSRDCLYERLRNAEIYARRYFYPLISEFPMYRGLQSALPANLPQASIISRQVICLPIYPALEMNDVYRIAGLIANAGVE